MDADSRSEATGEETRPTRERVRLLVVFLSGVLTVLVANPALAFASSWVQYRPPWVLRSAYSAGYEQGSSYEVACSNKPTGHTGCATRRCGTAASAIFKLTRDGQPPRDMLAYEDGCMHAVEGLSARPPSLLTGED